MNYTTEELLESLQNDLETIKSNLADGGMEIDEDDNFSNISTKTTGIVIGGGGGTVDKNSTMLVYYVDYTDRIDADPKYKEMHDKLLDGYKACLYVNDSSFKPTILYPTNVNSSLMNLVGYEYRDDSNTKYGVTYGTVRKHIVSVSFSNGEVYSVNVQYVNDLYLLKGDTQLLGINNNVTYTPANDYNPATKKYVDDAISGTLGGSY